MNVQELIPSFSIEALVMRRNAMVERIKVAHEALREVDQLGHEYFGDGRQGYRESHCTLRNYTTHTTFTEDRGLTEAIKEVDSRAWAFLLDKSGLRSFMDAKSRETWDNAIHKNDVPELTEGNIHATFATMYEARGDMFERGVVEIFRGLSWDYKTNCPLMFKKRIILRHIMGSHGLPDYAGCDRLDDLMRVFSVLDGKPEPDHRRGVYRALNESRRAGEAYANDYFSIRTFGNGNGHLTFLRPDLVDKMNAILAKHYPGALAASREAA